MFVQKSQEPTLSDLQTAGRQLVESVLVRALQKVCLETITANFVDNTQEAGEIERAANQLVQQVLINACHIYLSQLDWSSIETTQTNDPNYQQIFGSTKSAVKSSTSSAQPIEGASFELFRKLKSSADKVAPAEPFSPEELLLLEASGGEASSKALFESRDTENKARRPESLSPSKENAATSFKKRIGNKLSFDFSRENRINTMGYFSTESPDQDGSDASDLTPNLSDIIMGVETPDDVDLSVLNADLDLLEAEEQVEKQAHVIVQPIAEYTAEQEYRDSRNWCNILICGVPHNIDLRVVQPYMQVISHGGYLTNFKNDESSDNKSHSIIVFSSCYLPENTIPNYGYTMNNLFNFIISRLEQLALDNYSLVYFHGGTTKSRMPPYKCLKQCYQAIDYKLKKNLKQLYLVHPTLWLRTLIFLSKPFVSSKFKNKVKFVSSLKELNSLIPVESIEIPTASKLYDSKNCGQE